MKGKRGVVEFQFNWIFVLVIGGAILLLFGFIALKQKSSAEKVQSQRILKDIRALVTTATVSSGTSNSVRIGKNEIGIECNALTAKDERDDFLGLIMFSPDKIKGDKFITQTLTMEIPFRAANVVIGSSDEVRYNILDDNSELSAELKSTISDKFNIEFKNNIGYFENKKNNKVRFVFLNEEPASHSSILNKFTEMPDNDVTAVKISGDENGGSVTYYKKNKVNWASIDSDSNKNTVQYADTTTLIGAIFLDAGFETVEKYNCVMGNLIKRIELISNVYYQRSLYLRTQKICRDSFGNDIYAKTDSILQALSSNNLDLKKLKDSMDQKEVLEDANKELQRQSCPMIY